MIMMMSRLVPPYPGDHVVGFLLVTVLAVTVITGFSMLMALPLVRRPALRHGVLLSGLVCTGTAPFFTSLAGLTQYSLIHVNLPSRILPESPSPTIHSKTSERGRAADGISVTPVADIDVNTDTSNEVPRTQPQYVREISPSVSATSSRPTAFSRPVWFRVASTLSCLIWATGSLILLIRYVIASARVKSIRRNVRPLSQRVYQRASDHIVRTMNLGRLPEIATSRDVRTPVVIGLLRPQIVLPESLLGSLSDAELNEILIHETAHVIRRDLWVIQWEALTMIMCWPIPLVSLLVRELSRAREELCDIHVVKTRERHDYGRTLLRVARITDRHRALELATGILQGPGRLESRVIRLLDSGRDESTNASWTLIAGVLTAFLVLTGVICGTRLTAGNAQDGDVPASSTNPETDDGIVEVDESTAVQKIELLGGKIERDQNRSSQPVIGVSFVGNSRFTDGYMRLLRSLKDLKSLTLESNVITDAGMKQIWKLNGLTTLKVDCQLASSHGLKGLGGLKNLTTLILNATPMSNEGLDIISAESAKELGELTNLTTLDLQGTMIADTDRIAWQKLKKLTTVSLDTQCNDALLKGISELTNLTSLALEYGQLNDASLREIVKLQNLTTLNLRASNIRQFGVGKLSELKNLTTLDLDHTQLTDEKLKGLAQFKNLTSLKLRNTEITNRGLKELNALTKLTLLDLTQTKITDAGLKELSELKNLTSLELDSNQLTDACMAELKNHTNLTVFSISGEKITDVGVKHLSELKNLTRLGLSFTRLTENGMKSLKDLKNLRELSLHWALVNDKGMKELAGLSELRSLDLAGAQITNESLENISTHVHLTNLTLRDTRISNVGLKKLVRLVNLTDLDLCDAKLSDADLAIVSEFKNLARLDLSGVPITDEGLNVLSGLKSLNYLNLRHTQITNKALKQLRGFTNLTQVDVANTKVSDAGLPDILELKNINVLYVAKKQLTDATLQKLEKTFPTLHIEQW